MPVRTDRCVLSWPDIWRWYKSAANFCRMKRNKEVWGSNDECILYTYYTLYVYRITPVWAGKAVAVVMAVVEPVCSIRTHAHFNNIIPIDMCVHETCTVHTELLHTMVAMLPKGHFAIEVDECDGTSVAIIRGYSIVILVLWKKRGETWMEKCRNTAIMTVTTYYKLKPYMNHPI